MRPVVAFVAGLTAAAVAAGAGAAPQRNELIRPAVGIGKLRLGMTEAQVRAAFGRPRVVVRRRAGFGAVVSDWEFGYAEYSVRFFGRPGRLRATRVATTRWRERTPRGVGVGSLERTLRRTYRNLRCNRLETARGEGVVQVLSRNRTCTLFAPSGRRTIFTSTMQANIFEWPRVLADWEREARVAEVAVAEAR